jgi:hypothetical protein
MNWGEETEISEDHKSDENNTTESERVMNQDAREFTAGMRFYFMQEGNEGSAIPALILFSYTQLTEGSRVHSVNSSKVTNSWET